MNFRKIDESPKTFILVFKTGDELADGLLRFAKEQKLADSSFKAIGALSSVQLGWFNWETKRYEPSVTLDEQVELLEVLIILIVIGSFYNEFIILSRVSYA